MEQRHVTLSYSGQSETKTDRRNREAMVAIGREARVVAQSVQYGHSTGSTLVMDWKWRVLSEKEESDLRNWVR